MILALTLRVVAIFVIFFGGITLAFNGHLIIAIALHALLVGYLLGGTLNPASRLFGPLQTRCENGIWLTLDDGPDPVDTPAILDLLDAHQAKVTFFVIGKKAANHPELIREIVRRGHSIGNHSWSHPQASFWCLGPIRTFREIAKCQQILREITGTAPSLFRAPVGHYNIFVHPILNHFGLELIGWSSRGFDAVDASLDNVSEKIQKTLCNGAIVLAHESTPIAREVVAEILQISEKKALRIMIPGAARESDNY